MPIDRIRPRRHYGALGFFVMVLALSIAPVMAKPGFAQVRLTPAQFVSNCQSMGGTASPEGGAAGTSIKCRLPSGLTVTCSFNGGQAICTWGRTAPASSIKDLLGVMPDTMAPSTGTPKGAPMDQPAADSLE